MSGRSNIHGLGQLSGGASSTTTTQVTSSSENFPGQGQVLGGGPENQNRAAMAQSNQQGHEGIHIEGDRNLVVTGSNNTINIGASHAEPNDIHGLGQLSGGASTTTQVTSSSENFPGQGQVLGGGPENQNRAVPFAEEHFQAVIDQLDVNGLSRLFGVLRGLSYADIAKIIQSVDGRDVFKDTEKVLNYWIIKNGIKATRKEIIDGLEKSVLNAAKENLKKHWQDLTQKCVPEDSQAIIMVGEIAWNDLYKMFLSIGLADFEIQLHVQSANVAMNARKVFQAWKGVAPAPTLGELLDNLKSVGNLDAAQVLGGQWGIQV